LFISPRVIELPMPRTAYLSWPLVCLALLLSAGRAQAESINDTGFWTALFAQGDLDNPVSDDDRLKWWFDGHLRFLDDADGFHQSIVRPGLGWALDEQNTVWAGYAWIRTSPIAGLNFDENRIWQ
jgi:hypothetical protein